MKRHQRLARVHPDADVDGEPGVVRPARARGLLDRERRPNGTLGVVLMGCRRAEDAHDGIADELLDGSAEALELSSRQAVVDGERPAEILDVELLAHAREAHHVGEERAHELALLLFQTGPE